jgi:hypothetical protein
MEISVDRQGSNSPTLQRLIALLAAGYAIRVKDSSDNGNILSLEHPSKWQRVKEKSLFLYENGDVLGLSQHSDGTHLLIEGSDHTAFQQLISATPRPTWWDLNHGPFVSVFAWLFIALVLFAGVKIFGMVLGLLTPLWA